MTEEKGLDPSIADKIGEYVRQKGSEELLQSLQSDTTLAANESAAKGLSDISLLFGYLKRWAVLPKMSLDMSLARGLDYYTGVIYEVVTEGSAPTPATTSTKAAVRASKKSKAANGDADEDRSADPSVGVGSVAAGGRYDDLVGMFSGKQQIPCVGISFGVDRIFSIIKSRLASEPGAGPVRSNEVDVYVMALGGGKDFTGLLDERMEVCRRLWDARVKAEFSWKVKPKLQAQFKAAEQGGVPFAIIIGDEEWAKGQVKIKELGLEEGHPEKDGVVVDLGKLEAEVWSRLSKKAKQTKETSSEMLGDVKALSLE